MVRDRLLAHKQTLFSGSTAFALKMHFCCPFAFLFLQCCWPRSTQQPHRIHEAGSPSRRCSPAQKTFPSSVEAQPAAHRVDKAQVLPQPSQPPAPRTHSACVSVVAARGLPPGRQRNVCLYCYWCCFCYCYCYWHCCCSCS